MTTEKKKPINPVVEILQEAINTISNRAESRDTEQERSMADIVKMFNVLYGTNLTETQGWVFMILLKIKRASLGKFRPDDYVDGAAYFGLAGESHKNESEST